MKMFAILLLMLLQLVFIDKAFCQDDLMEAVSEFNGLQSSINDYLKNEKINCSELGQLIPEINNCDLKNYCKKYEKELDRPIFYSRDGEQMINEGFIEANFDLMECYKGTFKDELDVLISDFEKNKKTEYLKTVNQLNNEIKTYLKNNSATAAKWAQVQAEVLSMRLSDEMEESEARPLKELINLAEKNLRLKLPTTFVSKVLNLDKIANNPSYKREVKIFERSVFKGLEIPSPFYDFSQFLDSDIAGGEAKLIKNQETYQKNAKRVHAEFLKSKKALISYLSNAKNEKNKNEIERAIKRVELIKFSTPNLSSDYMRSCEFPNAFYEPESNTVTICPQYFTYPEINLFEVLSHELSHSIDPCVFSMPMKVKTTSLDIVTDAPFDVKIDHEKLNRSEIELFGFMDPKKVSDQGDVKNTAHPFSNLINCLHSSKSINASVPDKDKVKIKLQSVLKEYSTSGRANESNPQYLYLKNALTNFDDFFSRYGQCHIPELGMFSELEESYADAMANELVVEKILKMPKEDALKEVEKLVISGLNSDSSICPKGKLRLTMDELATKAGCREYYANKSKAQKIIDGLTISNVHRTDSHPDMDRRINRILFAHPEIRKILNCPKDRSLKYCENK